jgi:hypothetical protein
VVTKERETRGDDHGEGEVLKGRKRAAGTDLPSMMMPSLLKFQRGNGTAVPSRSVPLVAS